MTRGRKPRHGDNVRVERDEVLYPPKGGWHRYRGRVGRVISINTGGLGEPEYGVVFSGVTGGSTDAWFNAHELRVIHELRLVQ